MAISQARYAAELVDRDEHAWKFDDIGCMLRYARAHGLDSSAGAWFVRDYDGAGWLDALRAEFVRSGEIPSPMASGLIAFSDPAKAAHYAARFHGRVLRFADLWK